MKNTKPSGPLSWEEAKEKLLEEISAFTGGQEIHAEIFADLLIDVVKQYSASRVQSLEEELAMRNKYYEDKIESMQKSIDYWHTEDTKARAFVDKLAQHNAGLEEENKRLQERLSAADEAIEWLNMFRKDGGWGDDQTHNKIDLAIEKYNSLKK